MKFMTSALVSLASYNIALRCDIAEGEHRNEDSLHDRRGWIDDLVIGHD